MKRADLELRKELAVTRLRVARAELALARTYRPDSLASVSTAVDLASSLLHGRSFGRWGRYAQVLLQIAHVVLGLRRAL